MGVSTTKYEVRCPMHGSIPFNDREKEMMDHPFFQRLRSISQLGFASYVYPGATHTRFNHGLGAMHLAGRIYDHMVNLPGFEGLKFGADHIAYCRQIVRFAGLLHDTGHAPFSHAFEPLLPSRLNLELPREWYRNFDPQRQASHEDYSVALIFAIANESKPLLSLLEAQDICSLIHHEIRPSKEFSEGGPTSLFPLLRQIISGEIDVDRMDYLRRDAYFAGVSYGYFDQDRLIQSLGWETTEEGVVMTLDESAVYTFENFLMTRFHMAMQVYLHKTVVLFDHYLVSSVQAGEIECPLENGLNDFLATREEVILARLYKAKDKFWASHIIYRKPFSRLIQLPPDVDEHKRHRMLEGLKAKGVNPIHIRTSRRLSTLGEKGTPPILLRSRHLGKIQHRPLHEASVLLEKYNQDFVIENIYCKADQILLGQQVLQSLE